MPESTNLQARAPAPWSLTGRGFVLVYRFNPDWVRAHGNLPEGLRDQFEGGHGAVMLVDYLSSGVGPYRELLFIPGVFRFGQRRARSVTRILVSTEASAVNGRANWGLPKERADFFWEREGGVEHVRVHRDGETIAELRLRGAGFELPVTTSVVPAAVHTLGQVWEERVLMTTPSATGRARRARLLEARVEPRLFPDFAHGAPLVAVEAVSFRMTFPVAEELPEG